MAFLFEDDEEEEQQSQGQPLEIANTDTSGAEDAGTGNPNAGTAAPGGPKGYTDVKSYVDANQAQSGSLAGRISGRLSEEAQGIRTDIGSARDEFNSYVDSRAVNPDNALVDEAASNPTNFAQDQNKLAGFHKQRDASYSGPMSFEETDAFSPLNKRVQEGKRKMSLVDSDEGRKELLYGLGTNPTAGMVALDELLLGADPNARATLQQGASSYSDLDTLMAELSGGAKTHAQQAKERTELARRNVQTRFADEGGVVPEFSKLLEGRASTSEQERTKLNNQIQQLQALFESGYPLPPGTLEGLGYTPNQIQAFEGLIGNIRNHHPDANLRRMGDFYSGYDLGETPATRETVASGDEFAYEAALEQLMGQDYGILTGQPGSATYQKPSLGQFNLQQATDAYGQQFSELDAQLLADFDRWSKDGTLAAMDPAQQQALLFRAQAANQRRGGNYNVTIPEPEQPAPVPQPGGGEAVPPHPYPTSPQPTTPPDPMHPIAVWDPWSGTWGWIGFGGRPRIGGQ